MEASLTHLSAHCGAKCKSHKAAQAADSPPSSPIPHNALIAEDFGFCETRWPVSHHQPAHLGGGRVLSVAVLRSRGQPVGEPSVCNAVPPQSGDHTGVQVHTQVRRHKGADVYTERACRLAHTREYVCAHRTCAAIVNHRDTCCCVQRWQAFMSVDLEVQPILPPPRAT